MKWGIVGAGRIAHRFSQSLKNFDGCELYAVACRSQQKADAFAKEHGAKIAYAGYDAIVNDGNVDAVYISVPHQYHFTWIMKCLNAKKAVLCEKPACLSEEEMKEVIACAKKQHVLFMEAMKERFQPTYQRVVECVRQGIIGKLTSISTSFCNIVPPSFLESSYLSDPASKGCLSDLGIYGIAWIEDFTESIPTLSHLYADEKDGVYTYIRAEMQAGDVRCTIECGMDRDSKKQTILTGTKGSIVVTPMHRPLQAMIYTDQKDVVDLPYVCDDFYGEILEFVSLFEARRIESTKMSFMDSLHCAKILDRIDAGMHMDTHALELLQEEEQCLSFPIFTKDMMEYLGALLKMNQRYFERSAIVQIIDEETNEICFSYIPEGKEKNALYLNGKRNVMKETGHSSLYAWVEHEVYGKHSAMQKGFPKYCLSAGGFPIYVNGVLKYSVLVSGLHEGQDHELIRMCLYAMKNMDEKRYPYRMV